ncbi:MAG: DNA cytosine methyltransferase [Chitinophagaceae bacterium]
MQPIPIIDLFAGPGGLGEGFTSVVDKKNNRVFRIALSIERDEFAHRTLTLRSFLRQFPHKKFPKEYYQFVRDEIKDVQELYKLYPKEAANAKHEVWKISLGSPNDHKEIDRRITAGLKGEINFVLIGGPPCQAYSLVGRARRQEGNGLNKEDERVYLYREYYRILGVHKPPVFIMENVKGLLSSKIDNKSVFRQLIQDLQNPVESYRKLEGKDDIKSKTKYRIFSLVKKPIEYDLIDGSPIYDAKDFVIQAEKYGIPQTRHRVILLGIRNDIDVTPEMLIPGSKLIPVEDVISGLPSLRSGLSKTKDGKQEWKQAMEGIVNTILKNQIDKDVWEKMLQVVNNLSIPRKDRGDSFIEWQNKVDYQPSWYLDNKLKGACNHETRSHIVQDLYRYLFVSCFAKVKGRSPKLSDFPKLLLPKHENVNKGIEENKFADRFRTQLYGQPSKTVTSHISKDGHYFIHPDSAQCRSMTVREAARIQTFPDNYYFCGPRTEQFHQVGNAVPPLLAQQIASIVQKLFD